MNRYMFMAVAACTVRPLLVMHLFSNPIDTHFAQP